MSQDTPVRVTEEQLEEIPKFVVTLRSKAETAAYVLKLLADDKTLRNRIAEGVNPGDIDYSQGYHAPAPDETFEWRTADLLERLLSHIASLELTVSATQANADSNYKRWFEASERVASLERELAEARGERDELRRLTTMGLTVGGGLMVYGHAEAIGRVQNFILLDSTHPVEKEDVRRSLARDLQAAESSLTSSRAEVGRLRDALTSVREMLRDGQGEADLMLIIDAALSAVPPREREEGERLRDELAAANLTVANLTLANEEARKTIDRLNTLIPQDANNGGGSDA